MITKKSFECGHCGKCCKPLVSLNLEDIERIKALGYDEADFVTEDNFDNSAKVLKQIKNQCMFLNIGDGGKSRCSIYEDRPHICRKYPFMGVKKLETCKPNTMFEDAMKEARELLDKRGFI